MALGSPKLIQRLAAAASFTNTASHTLLDSLITPANWWTVGKILNWVGAVAQSAVNGTDTLQVRCLVGPTTLTGTAVADSGAVTGATTSRMTWNLWAQCMSSTTMTVWGSYSILGVAGTVTHRAGYAALTGLDFTVAQRFEVTGLWSAASTGNVAAVQSNVYVEYPG